jgi:two-component system response regulator NreC
MKPIRVLIVDDHAVVRSGLRLLLEKEPDIIVVGEASTGEEAFQSAISLDPDVILMDITLPDMTGLEATRRIHICNSEIKIIALTMHKEDVYLLNFLEAGGVGYVHKSSVDRDVMKAIRCVMKDDIFLQPEAVQYIARQHHSHIGEFLPSPEILSDRELQVLKLLAYGFTCSEIAKQLSLSARTIETYRERMMNKLAIEHRSGLVEYALHFNLIS